MLLIVSPDKIRPKWDWKEAVETVHFPDLFRIKSDQNGIESLNMTL